MTLKVIRGSKLDPVRKKLVIEIFVDINVQKPNFSLDL